MPKSTENEMTVEAIWRKYLTTGQLPYSKAPFGLTYPTFKRFMHHMPSDPRCTLCNVPFEGIGAPVVRALTGRTRSRMNPNLCNVCEQFAQEHQGGAEVELSMLFADIRGSTRLAHSMSAAEYSQRISRFYRVTADILIDVYALIEKLIGDEVAGLFVPGVAGQDHARKAVEASQAILRATGHGNGGEPRVPVGIGVHTGVAFVGSVGSEEGVSTITALGDAVNITARLASAAGPGEVLVSEATSHAARLDSAGLEARRLSLKGLEEPTDVHVLGADTSTVFLVD